VGTRSIASFIVGLLVFITCFGCGVVVSQQYVPLQMHDDYEYTYPAFNLVRAGNIGSPLRGTGLNIEHRTYHLVVHYYSAVLSVLIRIFGDRTESIPLANLFHFALIVAMLAAYGVLRPICLTLLVAVAWFTTDTLVLRTAVAGRPEMTVAFGYALATLMLYERLVWKNISTVPLALASCGAVASALSHTAAGVILLAPIFALFILVDHRRLTVPRNALAFVAPFFIPVVLYAYFLLTDDWRNIYLQLHHEFGEQTFARHLDLVVHGRFGQLWTSSAALRANFHFGWVIGMLGVGVSARWALTRRHEGLAASRKELHTLFFFGICFLLSAGMNWFFLKDYVPSYTVIYRTSYYLALGAFISLAASWFTRILTGAAPSFRGDAAQRYVPIAVLAVVGLFFALRIVPTARRGLGIPRASYETFRQQLSDELVAAGAKPGDKVYCPSPFGTHLSPLFRVVTFGSDQYFSDLWPKAFDEAVEDKSAFRHDEHARHFEKLVAFVNPKWIVIWQDDYATMRDFAAFLGSFPNTRPEIRITRARELRSDSTYVGTIFIYRVELQPEFSSSLDRSVHPERALGGR
jgi:hypothetical protein